MSMYDKNHYNIVISLQLIKINGKKKKIIIKQKKKRLHASNAGGTVSIPGWGIKMPYAMWYGQKKKKIARDMWNKREGRWALYME